MAQRDPANPGDDAFVLNESLVDLDSKHLGYSLETGTLT